uniref:Uncharacterized protein n=1 Tax=Sinocyclocheilus rhinocerous TaxID=307959 RepID=A0A673JC27_9TELE
PCFLFSINNVLHISLFYFCMFKSWCRHVAVLEWPVQSPDLTLIENIIFDLKSFSGKLLCKYRQRLLLVLKNKRFCTKFYFWGLT